MSTAVRVAALGQLLVLASMSTAAQASPSPPLSDPLDQAQALSQRGAQADAERILMNYLTRNPQSQAGHELAGLVKYREGVPDKSLDQYSLAAKLGPLTADDLRTVALDYVQLNDLPKSEHWLKQSIARNPRDWRPWRYLGGVQYSEEHPAEAAASFDQCLRLDPGNALAKDGLARSHEAMGNTKEAAEEYRQAIMLNSRSVQPSSLPLLHYGSYLRRAGRLSEAIPLLKQAEQLASEDWEAHTELAQAHEDNGDLKGAESEFQRAITLAPDRIRLYYMLARAYQRDGQKERAAAEMKLYQDFAAKNSAHRDLLDR